MKTEDFLYKQLRGGYKGYLLQEVHHYDEKPFAWDACKKMQRIPHKISYFIDRSKIIEVRKTTFNDPDFDCYYMKMTDNTYVELVY